MKSILRSCALVAALTAPAMVWAQTGSTVTRQQVRSELMELENAGYRPAAASPYYPADIQAAEARLAAMRDNAAGGYGTGVGGATDSGRPAVSKQDWRSMYDHS
ncbi:MULTISPECIES: DUF4148 domain-containing protein [Burkholderia cepacia complex]|uniref:DUF4148 domain-containing protein n=1 Tax=Burkholderia cepacia complex TaxID=87882 RepID=UPI001CF3AB43|nr:MULTISPECIES: DUF4148 domain-containing protein [Burkholderia cepacia complex]MCA8057410.1 DUF4148 domain-containing protein [Burkholderia cepacia]MDN7535265.1 DUF4148 domain-containing protein [Burkholderia orbicola]